MMSDLIMIDGDSVLFLPVFAPALVVVRPGRLAGSGPATVGGRKVCVAGDERRVAVPGCLYTTPVYSIPGSGTLKIERLASDQQAQHTRTSDKAVLLQGSQLDAVFEVQTPAQQPPPGPGAPVPDSTLKYAGKGRFLITNLTFKGT